MFHKEGHRIIIASFFFTISVIISSDILIGPENIKIILQSGFLFFYSMILWFFRNPKRNIIIDDNVILSPADGKIVDIKEVNENEFFKDDRIKISIFLSITNIHVTRFPISGKIIYKNLKRILSLGYQPLANNLLNNKDDYCELYPLELNYCENCHNCQLSVAVNPQKMFSNYLYTSSTS